MVKSSGNDKPRRGSKETRKNSREEISERRFFRRNRDDVPDIPIKMPDNLLAALARQTETAKSEAPSPNGIARRRSDSTRRNVVPDIPIEMPDNLLLSLKRQLDHSNEEVSAPRPDNYGKVIPLVIVTMKSGDVYIGRLVMYPIVPDTENEKDFLIDNARFYKQGIADQEQDLSKLDGIGAVLLNTANVESIRIYYQPYPDNFAA